MRVIMFVFQAHLNKGLTNFKIVRNGEALFIFLTSVVSFILSISQFYFIVYCAIFNSI